MNILEGLSVIGLVGNCWYHHHEFFKSMVGMKERIRRPVLTDEEDYRLPDKWEDNIKNNLNSIWEKYKGKEQITIENGQLYRGEIKKEKGKKIPNGKGILDDIEKFLYIGNFSSGIYEGEGQLLYSGGLKLLGNFSNGILNGRGIMVTETGNTYRGTFKDNIPNGKGKLSFPDGAFCIVNAKSEDDVMAECYEKNRELYYKGDFQGFKYTGKGKFYFENGEVYEGEFNEGKIEGEGRRLDKYGDELYTGNFVDNKYIGYLQERETLGYVAIGLLNVVFSLLKKKA